MRILKSILKTILLFAGRAALLGFGFFVSLLILAILSLVPRPSLFSRLPDHLTIALYLWMWGALAGAVVTLLGRMTGLVGRGTATTAAEPRNRRSPKRRSMQRVLMWVPSVIAAFFLFCFPIASHLLHPGSDYLPHYRIPTAWTDMILPSGRHNPYYTGVAVIVHNSDWGRFGLTPKDCWTGCESEMIFETASAEAEAFSLIRGYHQRAPETVVDIRREFAVGKLQLTCTGSLYSVFRSSLERFARVTCDTPSDAGPLNLHSWFRGREADLPRYFDVIQSITFIE